MFKRITKENWAVAFTLSLILFHSAFAQDSAKGTEWNFSESCQKATQDLVDDAKAAAALDSDPVFALTGEEKALLEKVEALKNKKPESVEETRKNETELRELAWSSQYEIAWKKARIYEKSWKLVSQRKLQSMMECSLSGSENKVQKIKDLLQKTEIAHQAALDSARATAYQQGFAAGLKRKTQR